MEHTFTQRSVRFSWILRIVIIVDKDRGISEIISEKNDLKWWVRMDVYNVYIYMCNNTQSIHWTGIFVYLPLFTYI